MVKGSDIAVIGIYIFNFRDKHVGEALSQRGIGLHISLKLIRTADELGVGEFKRREFMTGVSATMPFP